MVTPKARELGGWSRFMADEAIWPAQVITWWPMVSLGMLIVALASAILTGGAELRGHMTMAVSSLVVQVIYASLYGVAGVWIGARKRRGVWLALALFVLALVSDVLRGQLLGIAIDLLALVLIVRAGRAIGVRYLAPTS